MVSELQEIVHERPNNLPNNPGVFLGREDEIDQIKDIFSGKRFVILFGAGGVGKTRLASQAAKEMLERFPDGVFYIPLASISSSELTIDAIARAMNIALDSKRDPLDQLIQRLSTRNALLILDDFDVARDETDLFKKIFDWAPSIKFILTTRKKLNLPGETILEVKGLAFPGPDLADLETYPSVQLFLHHARLHSGFEPDLVSIGRLCYLVDGVPLGVELASAWSAALSCEQIAKRVEQNLSFLSVYKDSAYHRCLTAIFDTAWELFSSAETRVLMGLGIFRGSFSIQAAEKIAGASQFFLDALASKLLILRNGPRRYALHASFAHYLMEKLRADPLLDSHIEAQHNLFYLGFLRDSENALRKPVPTSTFDDVLAEFENIRISWDQMVTIGNYRALESAYQAWMTLLQKRGWFRKAIKDLIELDSKMNDAPPGVSDIELFAIRVKIYLGEFYYQIGDYEAGLDELQKGLQRAKVNGYRREESEIYRLLGLNHGALGRHADAREMYQQGLALAEKRSDLFLVYQFVNALGVDARQTADYPGAIPIVRRALKIARKLGDRTKIVESLNNLGNLYYETGDFQRARKLLAKTLPYLSDVNEPTLKSSVLDTTGKIATATEEYAYACRIFAQGLKLIRDLEAPSLTLGIFANVSSLLNRMNIKPLALTLVQLVADHPAAPTEINKTAVRLRKTLIAENIVPDERDWRVDQLHQVMEELIRVLDEKGRE